MEAQMLQMQQQMQQMAQAPANTNQAAPVAEKKSSKGPLIALAAVLFLVVGAGAVLGVLMTQQYEPDATNYTKVTLSPEESKDIVTVVGFTPLPKEEPVVAAVVEEEPKKTKKRRVRKSSSRKSSKKKATKKKKKFNISDDDLFGGGF